MSAPRQTSTIDPQRAGTIRRVVRIGARHLCGLCRSSYDVARLAEDCVRHCWTDLLALNPVLLRRRALRNVFRCRFCARDHSEHGLALQCAADCRRRLALKIEAERHADDEPESVPRTRRKLLRSAPVVLRAATPTPRTKRAAFVDATPAAIVVAPTPPAAPVTVDVNRPAGVDVEIPSADQKPAVPIEKGRKKKRFEDAHMFFRDGARYVCNGCKERYFTRPEVVTCFESHP